MLLFGFLRYACWSACFYYYSYFILRLLIESQRRWKSQLYTLPIWNELWRLLILLQAHVVSPRFIFQRTSVTVFIAFVCYQFIVMYCMLISVTLLEVSKLNDLYEIGTCLFTNKIIWWLVYQQYPFLKKNNQFYEIFGWCRWLSSLFCGWIRNCCFFFFILTWVNFLFDSLNNLVLQSISLTDSCNLSTW